jgi:hypothetical protein
VALNTSSGELMNRRCAVYGVRVMPPAAAIGSRYLSARRASSSMPPSSAVVTPMVWIRSGGVDVCGAAVAGHHPMSPSA